jgi:hypothetical protein
MKKSAGCSDMYHASPIEWMFKNVHKYAKYLELAAFSLINNLFSFFFIFINSHLAGKVCAAYILKGMCLWFI